MAEYQGRNSYNRNSYYVQGNAARRMEAAPDVWEEQEILRKKRVERARRQQEEQRRRKAVARRNQKHALIMSKGYVTFLSVAVIVTCITSIFYIKLQSDVTTRLNRIAALESSVSDMKQDNDAAYKRIATSVNLEKVKKEAINELGMTYPSSDQIVYYSIEHSDYMTQYDNIPD